MLFTDLSMAKRPLCVNNHIDFDTGCRMVKHFADIGNDALGT